MPFLLRSATVLLLFLAGASCDRPEKRIVGKWIPAGEGSDVVWEFHADKSVTAGTLRGKYSFGDNNRLKIQTSRSTMVNQVEWTEDRMIWKSPDGSRMEFRRAN